MNFSKDFFKVFLFFKKLSHQNVMDQALFFYIIIHIGKINHKSRQIRRGDKSEEETNPKRRQIRRVDQFKI